MSVRPTGSTTIKKPGTKSNPGRALASSGAGNPCAVFGFQMPSCSGLRIRSRTGGMNCFFLETTPCSMAQPLSAFYRRQVLWLGILVSM